jgi:hypothetical protein
MPKDNPVNEQQFQPEDAFLFAFDEAIELTANCLRDAGADEETIWQAFRHSLAFLMDGLEDVDNTKKSSGRDSAGLHIRNDYRSMIKLAQSRRYAWRNAASA